MSFHSRLERIVVTREQATALVRQKRIIGKKIVFTNGCFDILHPGHVDYLCKARDLGDFLVLGLNSDDSVRRLEKAPNRPINDLKARTIVLAGLVCIDLIVPFDEDTPLELITAIQPDVLVKGSDYKPENIVGYDVVKSRGGEIVTIPFLEGYSTTGLIQRIKA